MFALAHQRDQAMLDGRRLAAMVMRGMKGPAGEDETVYEEVIYEVDEVIATITLNRPEKLNALTDRTGPELRHAIATAEADPDLVGIILTGAGRGFCSGADMGMLGEIQEAGLSRSIPETSGWGRTSRTAIRI